MLRLILLVFLTLILSSCRYWALYKFADQFCEFDQNVSVSQQGKNTRIDFLEPVLARTLLLRYLHATPLLTTYTLKNSNNITSVKSDTFLIQRRYPNLKPSSHEVNSPYPYKIKVGYHLVGDVPLLSVGSLGPKIGQLFSPSVVALILKSICSDDYDLSLKRLDMRFILNNIKTQDLPSQKEFIDVFGRPDKTDKVDKNVYYYQFDFIKMENEANVFQDRPIKFMFGFGAKGTLNMLHVIYYKYDYWLDFDRKEGRLIVHRG